MVDANFRLEGLKFLYEQLKYDRTQLLSLAEGRSSSVLNFIISNWTCACADILCSGCWFVSHQFISWSLNLAAFPKVRFCVWLCLKRWSSELQGYVMKITKWQKIERNMIIYESLSGFYHVIVYVFLLAQWLGLTPPVL